MHKLELNVEEYCEATLFENEEYKIYSIVITGAEDYMSINIENVTIIK